ncbi:MAG: efflux RND transporter periplasmic adaptor subunit [Chloracidobacterium sp.]|nr:efflux RND transporter periplasmic adaptor subunit [Chloracidobacterium sp.]
MKSIYLLIVTAALVSIGCQKVETKEQQVAKPVKVKAVESHTAKSGSRYSATIRPQSQIDVGFKVGGYVESIARAADMTGMRHTLQAGDTVNRGQVLAQLRRNDYETKLAQAVSQKREMQKGLVSSSAQTTEAETSVSINRSQVAEAETALNQAKIDLARAKALYETQSMTKKDLEMAQTNMDTAQARVESAKASMRTAQSKIRTLQTQNELNEARIRTADTVVDQMAIPLGDATLRSPLTGVVLERKVEEGELVSPNAPAFVIADMTSVKAVFGVPDVELQKLKSGRLLTLTSDAIPDREFSGRVSRIAPSADPNSRVFEIEVTIPNPDDLLKAGMIASLEIVSESVGETSSVVPLTAVVRSKNDPSGYAVFVVQEIDGIATARAREIKLGEAFGNTVAVLNGVGDGEKVVTSGSTYLADGEKVEIVP